MSDLETVMAFDAGKEAGRLEERRHLWECMRMHWQGDMGPAHILVKDIEHLFKP